MNLISAYRSVGWALIIWLVAPMSVLADSIRAAPADTVTVRVVGTAHDARFLPAELEVPTGTTIRFRIEEGIHTVTAYHPDNRRDLGIPEGVNSFDSGPLGAGHEWHYTLPVKGEYNYFCIPHEWMGHTGQITATDP